MSEKPYTGKLTKIAVLSSDFSVPEGDNQDVYGVPCVHAVETVGDEEVHIMVAEVPKSLADEMIKCKRANLLSDVLKEE